MIYVFNCHPVDTQWQQYSTCLHTNSTQVDTRWQQYSTHLHTNSTQNTENGTYIRPPKIKRNNQKISVEQLWVSSRGHQVPYYVMFSLPCYLVRFRTKYVP
jgi:prolyl oligopeptidase PreP (S9A serine peptidase family)